jgi:hypothetical protein
MVADCASTLRYGIVNFRNRCGQRRSGRRLLSSSLLLPLRRLLLLPWLLL